MAASDFTHGTLIKNLATGTSTCTDCGLEVAVQHDLLSLPCEPRQTQSVRSVDDDDEDPVRGLWRLENEARKRRTP